MLISPDWFLGYDVLIELLFVIITLIVALFGFKVYKATSQRQAFYLSWGFLLISIAYISQSIMNLLLFTELDDRIFKIMSLHSITTLNTISMYVHMFFMLLGLATLTFMTLKSKDVRTFVLITMLSLIAVFLNENVVYMFYAISSLLLIIISWYFIKNFLHNKKNTTLLIAIAFLFLLFGSIHFLFAVNHQLFYVIGHFLGLVAYGLVLLNFLMVLKK